MKRDTNNEAAMLPSAIDKNIIMNMNGCDEVSIDQMDDDCYCCTSNEFEQYSHEGIRKASFKALNPRCTSIDSGQTHYRSCYIVLTAVHVLVRCSEF